MTWTKYGGGSWKTNDQDETRHMKLAIMEDVAKCHACRDGDMPQHASSYATASGGYTYQCSSFSRWYNPSTRKMEGHPHCTCDYCF